MNVAIRQDGSHLRSLAQMPVPAHVRSLSAFTPSRALLLGVSDQGRGGPKEEAKREPLSFDKLQLFQLFSESENVFVITSGL